MNLHTTAVIGNFSRHNIQKRNKIYLKLFIVLRNHAECVSFSLQKKKMKFLCNISAITSNAKKFFFIHDVQ